MRFRQVHLDFHTSEHIPDIGKQFDKRQFQEALKTSHVDSITVFSKCHHGWSYHPTKANRMHPNLSFDLLAAQIEAAHEIDVRTPVYISAGFDEKYAHEHPDHLMRRRDQVLNPTEDFSRAGYHLLCF
ncbi:MAG: beta-galactosidase, partial [Clostridia bacterium]|nr:beta-galactosidase [Clostridia bacterium]